MNLKQWKQTATTHYIHTTPCQGKPEAMLTQMDNTTRCKLKSCELQHNCMNKLYNWSATNWSNGLTALRQLTCICIQQQCTNHRRCGQQALRSMSFADNMIDFPRRDFLVPEGNTINLEIPNFLITQCRIGEKKLPKTSLIRSAVQIELRLVMDTDTADRHRATASILLT